jgi:hypothetical protein
MKVGTAVVVATLAAVLGTGPITSRSEALPAKSSVPAVLGMSYKPQTKHGVLAWFDPLTLRALPGRKAPLASHLGSWAFSADRAVLAVARCNVSRPQIRFVSARSMRLLGDLELSPYPGCAEALVWLRPDRLLAVVRAADAAEIVVVDPVAGRVLRRTKLPAAPGGVRKLPDGLVFLLTKEAAIAPAQVAVADVEGNVRTLTADRILAGTIVDESVSYRARTVSPGFAVDPDGRRAFLVPALGPVAEVDLDTLAVSYHELDPPSFLARFLRWLTPAAEAKSIEGPVRHAQWLRDGLLAVSGMDYSLSQNAGEEVEVGAPAGVKIVDTRTWRTRTLSPEASDFVLAPGLVIVQGGRLDATGRRVGVGIVAFGVDGSVRWRLEQPNGGWLETHGTIGYGYIWMAKGRMRVVELATGAAARTLRRDEEANPWPQLLDGQASTW